MLEDTNSLDAAHMVFNNEQDENRAVTKMNNVKHVSCNILQSLNTSPLK